MAGQYDNLDYPALTKRSFLLGVSLFLVGVLGEFVITTTGIAAPAWEHTVLFDAEALGIIIALLGPFVFGVVLPLTE